MPKLGKLPARPGAVKLELKDYLGTLPNIPTKYGHQNLITSWGDLGNLNVGDCVLAGAGHETMLWNREASNTVIITADDAISDYSAITGYNPNDPNSDQGTDMQVAASYRLKTGVKDSFNKRHKIGAYVAITPGNVEEIKAAIYLFSVVGIGVQFPDYAMDEFDSGQTWHLKTGGSIVGGHYIPAVGYNSRYVYLITWGECIKASWGFIKRYMDEGIVYLSEEFLTNNTSLEGFNLSQLRTDINQFK